jgi:hypothetical protein
MKRLFFLIFGITMIISPTTGQDRWKLVRSKTSSYAQVENITLQTECDPELNVRYLKYQDINDRNEPRIIDSVDCSPYKSELLMYGSKKSSDYLILWVTDYEYTSDIHVYLLTRNVISKIGELPVISECEICDNIIYPINRIRVESGRNEIIIKMLDPFKYDQGKENLKKYQPGELFFKVDKQSKRLIVIDLQKRTETQ